MSKEKLTLNTSVMLTPSFANKQINIHESKLDIKLDFHEGEHTFLSKPIEVGKMNDKKVYAVLSFWYDLDIKNRTLSLCSNELISENSPFLGLKHEQDNQLLSRQYAHTVRSFHAGNDKLWSHESNLYGNLPEVLNRSLCDTNDKIIKECTELGLNLVLGTPMPKGLSAEIDKYSTVYNKDGIFVEFYNPQKKYDDDHSIHPLKSTWYGEVTFAKNENIANVIGSTGDPKIAGLSWLQLWHKQFGQAQTCTSLYYKSFPCKGWLVGGHVITGTSATKVPAGANYVYIMPICTPHNNNDNVYMAAKEYQKGIALKNYLHSS
jgi:hypothetical protein